MHNYIALLWTSDSHRDLSVAMSAKATLLGARPPWRVAYGNGGALVMCQGPERPGFHTYPLANQRGVVLGSLFRRSALATDRSSVSELDQSETRLIVDSKGRHLVEGYWGSYVAIFDDVNVGSWSILRDPTANLPCYHTRLGAIHVFFSDIEDLTHYLPFSLSISWPHIAARLLGGFHFSRECGINGIEDVVGGERITLLNDTEARATLWHPAQFCHPGDLDNEDRAARELRLTVLNVTHALAAEHSNILLRLSGGLDSSIIAACLCRAPNRPRVTCINFFTSSEGRDDTTLQVTPGLSAENREKLRRMIGNSDERVFARAVAAQCGYTLVEKEKRASAIKLQRIECAPLAPRPTHFAFLISEDETECVCATESGATACFGGDAGDTVFYNTLRALGALDYLYIHPFGPESIRQILLTSVLSRESFARVLWKVIKHGLLRFDVPLAFQPMTRPHLLVNDVAAAVSRNHFRHPWVESAPLLCPGKRQHILGVAQSVATYPHVLPRDRIAPSVHPLAYQPVVELCLQIPTYVLLAGGVSRGLARHAFRDYLPTAIVRRTVKGQMIAFLQDAIRHNLEYIRQRLLDGILSQQGLLDRRKLDEFLTDAQPFLTVNAMQIMDYLACEGWADQVLRINSQSLGVRPRVHLTSQ